MHKLINLKKFSDERGILVAIEENSDVPFSIKRLFYIYDVSPKKIRGGHAHHLANQFIIALNGSCDIELKTFDSNTLLKIDNPSLGVFVPKLTWVNLYNFKNNAIILVLTDIKFEESDYIRDMNDFEKIIKNQF